MTEREAVEIVKDFAARMHSAVDVGAEDKHAQIEEFVALSLEKAPELTAHVVNGYERAVERFQTEFKPALRHFLRGVIFEDLAPAIVEGKRVLPTLFLKLVLR